MIQHRLATPDLVRLLDEGSISSLSEWQLLERFVNHRDHLAFEALVSLNGPMVLGICRRMLGNSPDVEDAFQATFLVLLKRAGSLGPADSIAAWLHGVAVRVAQQARSAAARRGLRERAGLTVDVPCDDPVIDPELGQILDEEINRLPTKYRSPIVLCYLEGITHEEAARQLQWPLGTVKGRLSRARTLLESRLSRRGVACGAALAVLAARPRAQAAVPGLLLETTCRAAGRAGMGPLSAQFVSTSVAGLVQGVLTTMIIQKLKLIALGVAVSGLFLTGAGVWARQGAGPGSPSPKPLGRANVRNVAAPAPAAPSSAPAAAADPVGKAPIPKSQADLLRDVAQAARHAYLATKADYQKGHSSVERVHNASRLLMEAEDGAASNPAQKLKSVEAHLERMRDLARTEENSGDEDPNATEARAFLAQAELLAAQSKAPKPVPAAPPAAAEPGDGPGTDLRSRAILAKLEEPVAMSFANETPLEDVLKYIKQATAGTSGTGIPIYVDPIGLQEAEKSMQSPVQLDLEGIPLRRTLQLALKQLGLCYFVDDGILVITSESAEVQSLPPTKVQPAPFVQKQEKADRGELSLEEMKQFVEELKVRSEIKKLRNELEKLDMKGGGVQ
jgi:RNA polymerase sigma factor (sigma-70 family)